MRAEKGITLVALVITIIVLLIIAVVSIGIFTQSRIVNYAGNAANDYNSAKAGEEANLVEAEKILNNITTKQ